MFPNMDIMASWESPYDIFEYKSLNLGMCNL